METVSSSARKTLNLLIENKTRDHYVDYQINSELIDENETAIIELTQLNLIESDLKGSIIINNDGLTFLARYKEYKHTLYLTSLWLPILASIITSIIFTILTYNVMTP